MNPLKIVLEANNNRFEWTGPWDSDFDSLIEIFLGLCAAAGFPDKKDLYEFIYNKVQEEHDSLEEYERRKKECPTMFK